MKKILLAVVAVLLMVSCNSNQNNGVGYSTVTLAAAATVPNQNETQYKKGHVVSTSKYGSDFKVCTAYYGEFNGHTWYVFYDNLAAPAVVHDPLCTCGGGK